MINSAQIDLFGAADAVPFEPVKKQKKRDVHAEAKEYVLAQLINLWFPELKNVMTLTVMLGMNSQRIEEPTPFHVLQR